jgi:hypothetical protein
VGPRSGPIAKASPPWRSRITIQREFVWRSDEIQPPNASGDREKKRGDGGDGPAAIRKTARRARRRMLPAIARKSEETAETAPQRSEKPHDEHDAGCFRRSREKARRRRSRPRSDQKRTGPPLRTALKIGLTGFEPATSTPPVWRATKLRYSPRSSCLPKCAELHEFDRKRTGWDSNPRYR